MVAISVVTIHCYYSITESIPYAILFISVTCIL